MSRLKRIDPPRPSGLPPRDSWWTRPQVQQNREAFDAEAAQQAPRMNAVVNTQHVQRETRRARAGEVDRG